MGKKLIRLLSLFLVVAVIISGCSQEDQSEGEEDQVTENVVQSSENEENSNNEISEVSEVSTKSTSNTSESVEEKEPTHLEKEFFNQLAGGFFYTPESQEPYLISRKASVDLIKTQMKTILDLESHLYQTGIKAYEDKLMIFIGQVDKSRTQFNDDFQWMLHTMMAHKTNIETLIAQGEGYLKKIEGKNDLDLENAVIYNEVFLMTSNLYEGLNEYLNFLESLEAYLDTAIIKTFNEDYALTLNQHTTEAFSQELLPKLVKVMKAYDQMSLSYTMISSGDYFYMRSMAEDIQQRMNQLDELQGLEVFKDNFLDYISNPKQYLIVISNDVQSNQSFKLPLIKKAYASSYDFKEYKNMTEIHKFIYKLSLNPNISEAELDEALMALVLQEHNVQLKEKKVKVEEEKKAVEVLRPETILALGGEKLMSLAGAEKVYEFVSMEGAPPVPIKIEKNEVKNVEKIEVSKLHEEVHQEIINKEKREKMIENLTQMQNSEAGAGASFLMMFTGDLTGDFVYNKIVKSFTDALVENKSKMKEETFKSLDNLLQKDLETILGSKKTAFANKFLNASAETLVNDFSDWVNQSINRKDIEINKDTLIHALNAMGFEHEGELSDSIQSSEKEEVKTDESNTSNTKEESQVTSEQEAVLLDYLSYMLPLMDGFNQEDLQKAATALNISKEEMYVYTMTTLLMGTKEAVDGDNSDDERVKEGLKTYFDGGSLDPWVKDYCFNKFYNLFNEKGDLDRWKDLSDEEKEALIREFLDGDNE